MLEMLQKTKLQVTLAIAAAFIILHLCIFAPALAKHNYSNSYYQSQRLNDSEHSTLLTSSHHQLTIVNASNLILTANAAKYAVNMPNLAVDDDNDELKVSALFVDLTTGKTQQFSTHLERSSVIFGLTMVSNASTVSEQCHQQLKHIQLSILRKEPWAMKVLDASGTKPSGFVFGQNFWLGSREACGAVQNPVAITLSKNFQRIMHSGLITENAPFDVDYRVVYLRHNSPWQVEIKLMSEQIIHIGLCLPRACDAADIHTLTSDYVHEGMFVENDIYDIRPTVIASKDLKLSESFFQRKSFKIFTTVLMSTLALALLASFMRVKVAAEEKHDEVEQIISATVVTEFFEKCKSFVQCFDVQNNFQRLFAIKQHVNCVEIPVINGLRSVCSVWIMVFHVMWFMYFTVNNKTFLISYAEKIFFQYVSSAPLLVDVFFTISGFLQTFNFMRNKKQISTIQANGFTQNCKLFAKMLFHRYLRLGPLYLAVMAVVDLTYAFISEVSVYHINERFDEICSQYWWRNLLFIQNLFDLNDMCVNWTWSLACEMQFFIVATILLFTYVKHPNFVKCIAVIGLLATITWTYAIGFTLKYQLSFDMLFASGNDMYISPFVRVLPYILGAMAAWFLLEKPTQLQLSDLKEKCLWNLAILIFFACIYSAIKRDMAVFYTLSLFVIGRFFFSLSVCWMIIGSATGRGSWWSRILEAKMFQHLNRLSYAIYLLNPFVIVFFFSFTNVSTHADPFMLCVLTSGFAVIVYLTSIVFSLTLEMPYSNLSSLLLRRSKEKSV